jgi:outer membrane murein-binding lipoprotein Lpp
MKMPTKLLSSISPLVLSFALLAGCSSEDSNKASDSKDGNAAQEQTEKKIDSKLKVDKATADQLTKDEAVSKATVQLSDLEGKKFVNADIEVDKTVKNIDEIAEKYAKELKEKYPDRTADILIIQEGKVVKQLTEK